MLQSDRIRLLFGPYSTPRVRLSSVLFDEARDCEVVVCGLTNARIPWPIGKPKGSRARSLIVFGDLAEAVRRESAQAVCHWWGVTGQTVTKWRKALGVPVTNEGTHRLRSEYTEEEWSIEARKKAHAKNGDPDRRAKIAAAKRGKPRPWSVIKKLIDAKTGSKHTAEAKAKMSEAHKRRGTRPPKAGRPWTAEEDEAVQTIPARQAALATKRTLSAVYSRRYDLKLEDRRTDRRLFRLDPVSGERLNQIATATTGDGGWVDLTEPIMVRAGDGFVAVPEEGT